MALTGGQERACSILLDGTSHSIHQEPWLVSNRYWKPFKFCKQDHMYQETFLQRYISAWDCWPEPLGALTFVIYFCICRPAIQAFQRMNYSTVEPPTLDSRNNGLSVIGTESHSNPKTRIVCIRKCSCIRKNGLSVIGTESHSNYTDYNQERQHQKLFLYQEQWLVSNRYWKPFKFYNQDRLHQEMFLYQEPWLVTNMYWKPFKY